MAGAEGFEPSALGFGVSGQRSIAVGSGRLRIRGVDFAGLVVAIITPFVSAYAAVEASVGAPFGAARRECS